VSWPPDWLRQRADDLLARDSGADPAGYTSAYDNLLWAVATAQRDELAAFVPLLYDDPYIQLPPPIQVVAFRLWGLEPPADPERARAAAVGIAIYCSPGEEDAAVTGLRAIAATGQ
jgi:hypothetical protein